MAGQLQTVYLNIMWICSFEFSCVCVGQLSICVGEYICLHLSVHVFVVSIQVCVFEMLFCYVHVLAANFHYELTTQEIHTAQ